jgi:hypothetical protein
LVAPVTETDALDSGSSKVDDDTDEDKTALGSMRQSWFYRYLLTRSEKGAHPVRVMILRKDAQNSTSLRTSDGT